MSRVMNSTFVSTAVGGLVAASLGLASCGGGAGSAGSGSAQPTPVSTPPVGTTATSTAAAPVADEAAPAAENVSAEKAQGSDSGATPDEAKPVLHSDVAVTKEGSRAIRKADSTRITDQAFGAQVDQVASALKAKDFKVVINRGVADTPTLIRTDDNINVMVFRSDKLAARQAANYVSILSVMKNEGRVARKHNVVVALLPIDPKAALDPKTLKHFTQVRHAAT